MGPARITQDDDGATGRRGAAATTAGAALFALADGLWLAGDLQQPLAGAVAATVLAEQHACAVVGTFGAQHAARPAASTGNDAARIAAAA